MDIINISKIINDKNMKNLPSQLNKTEQISPVSALKEYDIRYLTMKNLKDIRHFQHFRQYDQLAL